MTIEGVVEEIEPHFDLVAAARPLLQRLFAKHYGWSGVKERVLQQAAAYVEMLETLPQEWRDFMIQFRRRDYRLHLKLEGEDELRHAVVKTG